MRQISRKMWGFNIKTTIIWRVMFLRKCAKSLWHQILACWIGKAIRYRQLLNSSSRPLITTTMSCCRCTSVERTTSTIDVVSSVYHEFGSREMMGSSGEITTSCGGDNGDQDASDLVPLKICLLGDQHIGKTSFLEKYIGKENNEEELEGKRKDQMDKTVSIKGARISFSIWEVGGNAFYEDSDSSSSIPMACKDSVAMLFMFDLTSRRTLNSVINWHERARSYNQTAIPVMVGSKFDEFVQLPLDLQWTIANEARTYAKAINAPLFFSSASYNINVHKIFKFVTAKLFDLPWSLERNLTIGEPIIDF